MLAVAMPEMQAIFLVLMRVLRFQMFVFSRMRKPPQALFGSIVQVLRYRATGQAGS
ncbi:MAG: hypothetical protein ACPG7F_06755 [Aggregatilineales bacterium]